MTSADPIKKLARECHLEGLKYAAATLQSFPTYRAENIIKERIREIEHNPNWPTPEEVPASKAQELAAGIQAMDTLQRICTSCGNAFQDGDTCPRGGCPMGGDF